VTVQARAAELVREIKAHKAAIRQHRGALASAKAALDRIEQECAARGIRLVKEGEGEDPWPSHSSNSKH
jgi:prephenate dehydratase